MSPISEIIAEAEQPEINVRPAESEADAVAIHAFLCMVAQPVLLDKIDAGKSIAEVLRVVQDEAALMAEINGELVGTMGLVSPQWWYGRGYFFTDRWLFVIPTLKNRGVGAALLAEAAAIAYQAGNDLVINGHMRKRARAVGRGTHFTAPVVLGNDTDPDFDALERHFAI